MRQATHFIWPTLAPPVERSVVIRRVNYLTCDRILGLYLMTNELIMQAMYIRQVQSNVHRTNMLV